MTKSNQPQKKPELNKKQTENREKLKEFAKQLRRLKFPQSPISVELADYVASALESYLDENGKAKTLETAFGLNVGEGTPHATEAGVTRLFCARA